MELSLLKGRMDDVLSLVGDDRVRGRFVDQFRLWVSSTIHRSYSNDQTRWRSTTEGLAMSRNHFRNLCPLALRRQSCPYELQKACPVRYDRRLTAAKMFRTRLPSSASAASTVRNSSWCVSRDLRSISRDKTLTVGCYARCSALRSLTHMTMLLIGRKQCCTEMRLPCRATIGQVRIEVMHDVANSRLASFVLQVYQLPS